MAQFADRVKFSTSSTGTGNIAIGSAETGYQSVPAGLDGETLRIVIEDGTAWEISTATFTNSTSTLSSRTLTSSSTGSLLNLSGSAKVFLSPIVDDLQLVQVYSATSDLPSASDNHGRITHVHSEGSMYFAHGGNWIKLANASSSGGASALTIDIKTANYTVVAADLGKIIKYAGAGADRTVSLTAGATLGDGFYVTIQNANSGQDERVIIDPDGTEKFGWSNGPSTITLKRGELVKIIWDDTSGRWIIGEGGFNLGIRIDNNPSASVQVDQWSANGFAAGYNAFAGGTNSVALGSARSSGSNAFAAAISSNSSSYGSSGTTSVALGRNAKASASNSVAISAYNYTGGAQATGLGSVSIGDGSVASNINSVAIGRGATASGNTSLALARDAQATQEGSVSIGYKAYSDVTGAFAYASGTFGSSNGDAQGRQYILRRATSDATATKLTTDANGDGANNQVKVPTNSCVVFDGVITACESGVGSFAGWKVEGIITNDGGTTVLQNSAITVQHNSSSWGLTLAANDSHDTLNIIVTGEASHNIRWVANIRTAETIYA